MKQIYSELDHRLSVVKRWQVVPTIQTQSVKEHSYNVAIIAERIARLWFKIDDETVLYQLVRRGLYHDWMESLTGDLPSYIKGSVDHVVLEAEFSDYLEDHEIDIGVYGSHAELCRKIIKVADYIDALVFLQMEISMGNKSVVAILRDMEDRFKQYCHETEVGGVHPFKHAPELYNLQLRDRMFGLNGQYQTEMYRFIK